MISEEPLRFTKDDFGEEDLRIASTEWGGRVKMPRGKSNTGLQEIERLLISRIEPKGVLVDCWVDESIQDYSDRPCNSKMSNQDPVGRSNRYSLHLQVAEQHEEF